MLIARLFVAISTLLVFPTHTFAQPTKSSADSIYLFGNYFEDTNTDWLGSDAFLLRVKSYSIDLQNEELTVELESIAKLPLPSALIKLKSANNLTIDLSMTWHTVLVVDIVEVFEDVGGYQVVVDYETYTTVYGRVANQSGRSSYQLIVPRRKID